MATMAARDKKKQTKKTMKKRKTSHKLVEQKKRGKKKWPGKKTKDNQANGQMTYEEKIAEQQSNLNQLLNAKLGNCIKSDVKPIKPSKTQ